ncbi:hypothetical protein P689_12279 [Candidatus Riesia pediculischaeffi PTSU]|uniref:Uncharacterized protein n=1 Tax=Candidatus Riesia pediculischaeffi PTSU TaxID=1401651 RepID=A0A0C1VJ96_9ENTR|nr:hypothetical protein P689_12279 [Candidatus Riesia pediculischaeffi PTSU]
MVLITRAKTDTIITKHRVVFVENNIKKNGVVVTKKHVKE